MEISKETRKRMMQIIAFGILLYCGMEHFDVVIGAVDFVLGIVMPFLVGGAIAFVINVPMKSIERHLFAKNGKLAKWRRPVAYLLTLAPVSYTHLDVYKRQAYNSNIVRKRKKEERRWQD